MVWPQTRTKLWSAGPCACVGAWPCCPSSTHNQNLHLVKRALLPAELNHSPQPTILGVAQSARNEPRYCSPESSADCRGQELQTCSPPAGTHPSTRPTTARRLRTCTPPAGRTLLCPRMGCGLLCQRTPRARSSCTIAREATGGGGLQPLLPPPTPPNPDLP